MTTTFDKISAIIVRDFELPPERLRRDTLLEEIELDSLSITELVFSIEDEFQITAENTIPPFKTLGDIADYVARLIAERDTKPRVARSAEVGPAQAPPKPAHAVKQASAPAQRPSKPRPAAKGAASEPSERSGRARKVNGKANARANGDGRANGTNAGATTQTKSPGAKRPAAARAPASDSPPRKLKRSGGGRAGARAR